MLAAAVGPPFETGLLEEDEVETGGEAMADVRSPKGLGNPGHKAGGTRP